MCDAPDATATTTLVLDGTTVPFASGETILTIARRHARSAIPTLCNDERLQPFGACRLCIVEVDGHANPVAACCTQAVPGSVVRTNTESLQRHRKTLLEMVASEIPEGEPTSIDPLTGLASGELGQLLEDFGIRGDRFAGAKSGRRHANDNNPFIDRDYSRCIACYRCVRICAEQQGDHAIGAHNRGFDTLIGTAFDRELRDSTCSFCGQCMQTCPSGALADKKALRAASLPEPLVKTRSICGYCGVGCSVDILSKGDRIVGVQPALDGPANQGALCLKGQFAFDYVQHPDRLRTPLLRNSDGALVPASWDQALDHAAAGFRAAQRAHGRHSIYAIASGRAPHEGGYLVQKFMRAGFGSHYVDNCART